MKKFKIWFLLFPVVGAAILFGSCGNSSWNISVMTEDAKNITFESANLYGIWEFDKNQDPKDPPLPELEIRDQGCVYGTQANLDTTNKRQSNDAQFYCKVKNLNPNTTYYYKAFAIYRYKGDAEWMVEYGDEKSFKTLEAPSLSINDVAINEGNGTGNTVFSFTIKLDQAASSGINVDFATADGTATTADNDYTSASGTLYFTAGETVKTIDVTVKSDDNVEPDEVFYVNLSNIKGMAIIKIDKGKATIKNDDVASVKSKISINDVSKDEGNGTGNTIFSFTVSLDQASSSDITIDYATADGTAKTLDNDYTSASGKLNFTAGQTSKTIDVTVKNDDVLEPNEDFYVNLSNITGNATFTNNKGTGTIKNDDVAGIKDGDGNTYTTVTIGTQTWLLQNLKTTKYNDGTPITNITNAGAWSSATSAAYSWYNNDASTFKANNFGALYNWYVVASSKNVCPDGFHVPTDAEWTTLTTYLGSSAGGKMKKTGGGTDNWWSPNTGATNSSGFTALPTGARIGYVGDFYRLSEWTLFWSSTEDKDDPTMAWERWLYYDTDIVTRQNHDKRFGNPIRCIKD